MKKLLLLPILALAACDKGGDTTFSTIEGPMGPSCSVEKLTDHAVITCPDGSSAAIYEGLDGLNGEKGEKGDKGDPGKNGTNVWTVELCPSDTTVYPTTFVERGLCINGNLFAVYSQNGGFLTKLPPGLYISNAVGSNCTFEVKLGCKVEEK